MHAFTDMQRGNFAPVLLASLISTAANPVEIRSLREEGARRGLPGRQAAAEQGAAHHDLRDARHRPEQSAAQAVPGARGLRPHRRAGPHRQHRFRRSPRQSNYQEGDAPVSYPYVWNIWKFDWVQYNGSVAQPLARNVGEALGVGAITPLLTTDGAPLPPEARFRSSVDIAGLVRIEHTLQLLRPPRWPEDILGAIDRDEGRARRGAVQAALPGMSRSARGGARAPAGQRAAQAIERARVAHRSDSARPHRHGSQRRHGIHRAALRPFAHRPAERGPAGRAAPAAHALAAARCALPPDAKWCGCAAMRVRRPANCRRCSRRIRIPMPGRRPQCRSKRSPPSTPRSSALLPTPPAVPGADDQPDGLR